MAGYSFGRQRLERRAPGDFQGVFVLNGRLVFRVLAADFTLFFGLHILTKHQELAFFFILRCTPKAYEPGTQNLKPEPEALNPDTIKNLNPCLPKAVPGSVPCRAQYEE